MAGPPQEVEFPGQAVRAIETPDAEIIAHARKGATQTGDFPRVSVASDAPQMGLTENEDSRMDSEKSRDLRGVAVGNEKFRGVGIEPSKKAHYSSEKQQNAMVAQPNAQPSFARDSDLSLLFQYWNSLSEPIKLAVMAFVRTALEREAK